MNEQSQKISQKSERIKKIDSNEEINELYKESLISAEEFKFLCKYFFTIDLFTKIFNTFAMLSFAWCLLSLVGLFDIKSNFVWVNIFSLAIVFLISLYWMIYWLNCFQRNLTNFMTRL